MEQWKEISDAPGYSVSSLGKVRGKSGKLLYLTPKHSGYVLVTLFVDKKASGRMVHRLVAEAFLPKPEEKSIVNHVNGTRHDNRLENLEWASAQENAERKAHPSARGPTRGVVQTTRDGVVVREWDAIIDASRALGIDRTLISRCCRGDLGTAGGYVWMYTGAGAEDPDEEWRTIDLNGVSYTVSSAGRLRLKNGTVSRGGRRGKYLAYGNVQIHRLVALAFCPAVEGKNWVNHVDGNPTNNCALNLEWATPAENTKHAYDAGLKTKGNPGACRAVRRIKADSEVLVYPSILEAAKAASVCRVSITNVCRGNKKTAGGSRWEYVEEAGGPEVRLTDAEIDGILSDLDI